MMSHSLRDKTNASNMAMQGSMIAALAGPRITWARAADLCLFAALDDPARG